MTRDVQLALLIKVIQGMCFEDCGILVKEPDATYSYPRLIIRPHMAEFAIICGRGGRQIRSLKHLGMLAGTQVILEESRIGERGRRAPFQANPAFDHSQALDLLNQLSAAFLTEPEPIRWYVAGQELGKLIIQHDRKVASDDEADTLFAFSDVLWPWGFRHGQLVDVKVRAHSKHQPAPAQAA